MSVAADGEDIVIDSQVEWVEDRTLEGDVRVVAGGELTINGLNLVVSDDSQIIVDEGGVLNIQNSVVDAENPRNCRVSSNEAASAPRVADVREAARLPVPMTHFPSGRGNAKSRLPTTENGPCERRASSTTTEPRLMAPVRSGRIWGHADPNFRIVLRKS